MLSIKIDYYYHDYDYNISKGIIKNTCFEYEDSQEQFALILQSWPFGQYIYVYYIYISQVKNNISSNNITIRQNKSCFK